jgi:hypothetical protein
MHSALYSESHSRIPSRIRVFRVVFAYSESYSRIPSRIRVFRVVFAYSESYSRIPSRIRIFRVVFVYSESYSHYTAGGVRLEAGATIKPEGTLMQCYSFID